jgi:hypothetical protein
LGSRSQVQQIEVHWIGGEVTRLKDVAVDQRIIVTEGSETIEAVGPQG